MDDNIPTNILLQILTGDNDIMELIWGMVPEDGEPRRTRAEEDKDGERVMQIKRYPVLLDALVEDLESLDFTGFGTAFLHGREGEKGALTFGFSRSANGTRSAWKQSVPGGADSFWEEIASGESFATFVAFFRNPDSNPDVILVDGLRNETHMDEEPVLRLRYVDGEVFLETCVRSFGKGRDRIVLLLSDWVRCRSVTEARRLHDLANPGRYRH